MEMDIELLEQVKNYLDITYDTNAGEDIKLSGMINRGRKYLEGKIGSCDFENETQERQLLFDYCMYARAGALDEFYRNYKGEIIALQMERWAKKHAENQGS